MKIIVKYPGMNFEFENKEYLPKDCKYGCWERTKILRDTLRNMSSNQWSHAADDFYVERIQKNKTREIWHLGS